MKFIFFIFILLALILSANFYVFYRLWHLIPPFPASRIALMCTAFLLIALPFVSMLLGQHFPFPVSSLMYRVGLSWLMIMLYLVIIFFVLDLIRMTGVLPLHPYMYNSWIGFGWLSLLIVAMMTAGNINYHHKKRVELNIQITKNRTIDKPLKMVAVADLHLGYGTGPKELHKWVQLINREEPDVVIIAGDVFDNSLQPMYERNFADVLSKINTKYGIYLALGNHEYISNLTEDIDFLTKAGITVLRDSVAMVENMYIVGHDDKSNSRRKTVTDLTANLDKTKPIIFIDHQPHHFDEVEKSQVDLYIAGHTHDGQVFPVSLITKALYEISHGYLKKGNTHFYVTSGIGIWGGKFRIGTSSEYVVINLQ